jgi:hypothetical protein
MWQSTHSSAMTNGLMSVKTTAQKKALNVAGIALLLGELTVGDAAMDSMPATDGQQRIAAST